ncbi:ZYBA0S05-06150g1_1 [Zygosaccharomyces bailii CLIB 213]|uniref:ZYBA0S05-06150g1_1 n=1 Tax=Zygosaccharomyces bailii (strain CLIB 213 / ATCC 58445 / CBS 680 / BCRC 21525 / NBRC 1098 / NCYC 1416 / NRRL Y-2227) TaxID=1333698 RepID=A0A8J2T8D1_ZYGB2|nr:ZYBA0S05-06150g1_1 [Zygosaccharomyces bailii CLIB 213]
MPPKKKKISDEEEVNVPSKYIPGKRPRTDNAPEVHYTQSLDPESELQVDEWTIPKFNLFISFTLDNLVESYKSIFKDFIKLPSRKFHPQYYYRIHQPISINEIKSRDYEYHNGPHTFLLDVELLYKNCFSYNEPDSIIVKNSLQVIQYIEYEVLKAKNVTRNYLITDNVKTRLLNYLQKLIEATDKDIEQELSPPAPKDADSTIRVAQPFMELVDKDELPEYYEVIHRPMALETVKQSLDVGYYSKIYDLIIDVQLVFRNALVFNDQNTLIHQDALKLLKFFNHLMRNKFFPELQDASERGEVKLEYDKIEYEQYLANGGDENSAEAIEDDDKGDYDFNHFEGLGNGYNRALLSEDYLLGPNNKPDQLQKKPKLSSPSEDQPKVLKYNIVKALLKEKEMTSSEYTMERKPYDIINQVCIYSSESLYQQATNPVSGSRPSCNQNWVEFVFNGKDLSQNENMYSFTLQPVQTYLTLIADVDGKKVETSLSVNSETMKAHQQQTDSAQDDKELEPRIVGTERYDIRLNEGLNFVEYKCEDDEGRKETMRFWVNVLP